MLRRVPGAPGNPGEALQEPRDQAEPGQGEGALGEVGAQNACSGGSLRHRRPCLGPLGRPESGSGQAKICTGQMQLVW